MFVTQTYLGDVGTDAKLFVYYFFEDYNAEQKVFSEELEAKLGDLGVAAGADITLMVPQARYAGRMEAEVRKNRPLWELIREYLPGLFMSRVPLSRVAQPFDGCWFYPLLRGDADDLDRGVRAIRDLETGLRHDVECTGLFEDLGDAIELKPGMAGISIDIKKLFRKFLG